MDHERPSFLSIPSEIRELIYTALFGDGRGKSSILVHESDGGHQILRARVPGIAVLRTCRTIRDEVRRHARWAHLIFVTDVNNEGYEISSMLPQLGDQLTSSLFVNVAVLTVGASAMWRVMGSIWTLKTRMQNLDLIQAVVVKRLPFSYWKQKFPTITAALMSSSLPLTSISTCSAASSFRPSSRSPFCPSFAFSIAKGSLGEGDNDERERISRACLSDANREGIPDLELAWFRSHVRSRPLNNEDVQQIDVQYDSVSITEERGGELYMRPVNVLMDAGIQLHACTQWLLVDRDADDAVQLVVDSKCNFVSGRISMARRGTLGRHDHSDGSDGSDGGDIVKSKEPIRDLERQLVYEMHGR